MNGNLQRRNSATKKFSEEEGVPGVRPVSPTKLKKKVVFFSAGLPPSMFPRLKGHFGAGGQWFVQLTCNCDGMLLGNLRHNSNFNYIPFPLFVE